MISSALTRTRSLGGALLKDWRRYKRALANDDASYLALCNRGETLEAAPTGEGYRCQWQWATDLHAPKVLPSLGLRLLRKSLSFHPVSRASAPVPSPDGVPAITFLIGHRGLARLPHLLATLESIAGQKDATVECVVVEQDVESRIANLLPGWVRYVHTPPPSAEMPYCRSWAFNIGAQHATSAVLVLHDNDMIVPSDYSQKILQVVHQGYEVVNLKRFIFYLSEQHTAGIFSGSAGLTDHAPLAIVQNLEGGGSVAVVRESYDRIGGMDESFIGWGGEDNEFWERALTLKVWSFGSLPVLHLWHAAQPGKGGSAVMSNFVRVATVDPKLRISRQLELDKGNMSGPAGVWSHSDDR